MSFNIAFVKHGDQEALKAAIQQMRRGDLTADEAADIVEEVAPGLSGVARWIRGRRDEINQNQIGIVLAILGVLLALYSMRPVELSEHQMGELVEKIGTAACEGPSEIDIKDAVQRSLDSIQKQTSKQEPDQLSPTAP